MRSCKIFILLIIPLVLTFVFITPAQKKTQKKPAANPSQVKKSKKTPKIIAGGVVNGKAKLLVQPDFPAAARAINSYGMVSVLVLIDVDGNVISAKLVSGLPILRTASVNAALKSKFGPFSSGSEPVIVSGVIYYHFLPSEWNWLEIGYAMGNSRSAYYSLENLRKTFPSEFEEAAQLLDQVRGNNGQIWEAMVVSIENTLESDEKYLWFFLAGLNLAKLTSSWSVTGHTLENDPKSLQELKFLIAFSPVGIRKMLSEEIGNCVSAVENNNTSEVFSILRSLETNFPLLGR